ncbi:MAG TPA: UDP-N-acetylmuramoyl-tripeptide--D-alanyl-D-alanine ligase [Saprospiraceae bacterium]|nr:UDP-N-acetylmuramoyl-tripeptide--D-alanyl-D-alanine ligase [Saprospiraceae bacterium]
MDIKQLYDIFLNNPNVCTDTRKISDNCLFFALKGDRFNGNEYAIKALELGASYAIVDDRTIITDSRLIFVNDVLTTLQELARYHRLQLNIPVLGITGSNGKTTTKELSREVIKQKYKVKATIGNLNNHIGVPLTILDTSSDIEFLIVEMGANHQGEIDLLCKIALPDYVMITNIGKAHLEGFGGFEGVKLGKSEMYKFANNFDKKIFLNKDDSVLTGLIPPDSEIISYSGSQMLSIISEEPFLKLRYNDKEIATNLYGSYNLSNIAFAIKLGEYFSVDQDMIVKGIADYRPDNNRSQLEIINGNTIIKDAYNANPNSMKLSLESFAKVNASSKLVVLGDMLELGEFTQSEHKEILTLVENLGIKEAIYVGENFYKEKEGFNGAFYKKIEDAREYFKMKGYQNYYILLKGSRGISVESILS